MEIGIHSEIWYSIGPYSSSEPRLVPDAGLINSVFYFFFGGGEQTEVFRLRNARVEFALLIILD